MIRGMGGVGNYELYPSNGSYLRTPEGKMLRKAPLKKWLAYMFETDSGIYRGAITDTILVERIMEYMARYHGKHFTNCSALAHFLTTGEFVECSEDRGLLVAEQGMRLYTGQTVGVGDMLCIFYANERRLRSRKEPWRRLYLNSQKGRHEDGRFSHGCVPAQKVFTAQDLHKIQKDYRVDDYHFLVCVAKHNGEPVWIAQWGYSRPNEAPASLVLTVGEHDGYHIRTPFLVFIKKRRN
ncbi:MAG TPA: hypothetical protein VHD55_00750 [Candidatus Paceibacterota bacterium]|nr:hypothetical protein [Candidatus Paceibacterota bacterium]